MATRFWANVQKTTDCWLWTGCSGGRLGYGVLSYPGRSKGGTPAHRYSWELHVGPIPEGLCVLHHCDNPPCVRPGHLFLGTKADNTADMMLKGRHVSRRGVEAGRAKLTDDIVRSIRTDPRGYKALAKVYGVERTTIRDARKKVTWSHVQ